MPEMQMHATTGERTVWHPATPCGLCHGVTPMALVAGETYIIDDPTSETPPSPEKLEQFVRATEHLTPKVVTLDFAGSLFDAPPQAGRFSRAEADAARTARSAVRPVVMTAEREMPPRVYGRTWYSMQIRECARCGLRRPSENDHPAFKPDMSWGHVCGTDSQENVMTK